MVVLPEALGFGFIEAMMRRFCDLPYSRCPLRLVGLVEETASL